MKKKIVLIEGRSEVVEWWDQADFHGRFNMVIGADENMRPIADAAQLDVILFRMIVLSVIIVAMICSLSRCQSFAIGAVPACFKKLVP